MKWIGKLWRGEYELAYAFWICGVLVYAALSVAFKFLSMGAIMFMLVGAFSEGATGLLKGAMVFIFVMIGITYCYQIVACVGVWRSAGKYSGPHVYAVLARIASVLGFAVTVVGIGAILYVFTLAPWAPFKH